jgi:electron transfer flavoprotein beta subunit
MHILVPVKRVIDHNVKVRVMRDGSGVETNNVKMSLNPFDEVAIEQALRLREQGLASKVTVVTCGPAAAQDVLRTALALGADAALLVDVAAPLDSLAVARTLHALVMREQVGLVICGKQAIDDDLGATGRRRPRSAPSPCRASCSRSCATATWEWNSLRSTGRPSCASTCAYAIRARSRCLP